MPFSRDTPRPGLPARQDWYSTSGPFGTQEDVYREGYEWMHHSVAPKARAEGQFRITIGGPDCTKPYSASGLQHLRDELWRAQSETRCAR